MSRFQVFAAVVLACGLVFTAGCGGGKNKQGKVKPGEVRRNMSPELHSTAATYQQELNMIARSNAHTSRQFWDDLAWLFLLDEPLHLTEYPVP